MAVALICAFLMPQANQNLIRMRNLRELDQSLQENMKIYENVNGRWNEFIRELEDSLCDDSNSIIED